MKGQLPVRLGGDHPHAGESGYIETRNGKIRGISVFGRRHVEVVLENCVHGVDKCYAESKHVMFMGTCPLDLLLHGDAARRQRARKGGRR